MNIIETSVLGKRYGGTWALRECTLAVPAGHVAALVGPNGAGKTTLLNLAVGLAAPSAGGITVLGGRPAGSPAALDGIAFVAQDTPLYRNLRVADMIYVTRNLNRRFDQPYARARLAELGIPLKAKAGKLSGGQQAQVALTLALARRPRLLVLDEPVAMLDPVARHDFMATVRAAAAGGVSVLLSSHVLTELERVATYLVLLSRGQTRLAGVVTELLGALAIWLWLAGSSLHHAYAAAVSCHPAGSPACQSAAGAFNGMYAFLANGTILQAVPVVIGAFVGAPLLARELETGTFRYAWTQGFGRRRWALAKLVPLAVVLTAVTWAFSLLSSWYYQPYFASGNQARGLSEMSPFNSGVFDLHGVAFAAWTLTAFAIGALAGMLLRRVVPAVAATVALYVGLAFAAGALLREHYLTPLVTASLSTPGSAWILSQWWTNGGVRLSQAAMYQPINATWQRLAPAVNSRPQKAQAYLTVLRYLTHHGYTYWTRYQPGSRFWTFQWIESGWLLALSVLLTATTIWLVRRRAT